MGRGGGGCTVRANGSLPVYAVAAADLYNMVVRYGRRPSRPGSPDRERGYGDHDRERDSRERGRDRESVSFSPSRRRSGNRRRSASPYSRYLAECRVVEFTSWSPLADAYGHYAPNFLRQVCP